ncbi:MAG: hypothetical protein KC420_02970 [Myxococcales bacterium]|nr:hypothetical protein [Myxococcales bacterium]
MRSGRSKIGAGPIGVLERWWSSIRPAIRTAFPAFVVDYDHGKREATVQPSIKRRFSDGRPLEDAPPISKRPVVQVARGAGWIITHGLQAGDQVLVLAADRALDTWTQSDGKKTVAPEHRRYHNASDSIVLPGVSTPSSAPTEGAADELYLGREDGSTSIRLGKDGTIEVRNVHATITLEPAGAVVITPGPGTTTKLGGPASARKLAMNVEVLGSLQALAAILEAAPEFTQPTSAAISGWKGGLVAALSGSPNGRDT